MLTPALAAQVRPLMTFEVETIAPPVGEVPPRELRVSPSPSGYYAFAPGWGLVRPDGSLRLFPKEGGRPERPPVEFLIGSRVVRQMEDGIAVWDVPTNRVSVYPGLDPFVGNGPNCLDSTGVPVGGVPVGGVLIGGLAARRDGMRMRVPARGTRPLPLPPGIDGADSYQWVATTTRAPIYAAAVGRRAFVWRDPTRLPQSYPLPKGTVRARIYAVNPRGDFAGAVYDAKRQPQATVWRGGRPHAIPGGPPSKHPQQFWAWGILDDGLLVGGDGEDFWYGSELWVSDGGKPIPWYQLRLVSRRDGQPIEGVPSSRLQVAPDGKSFVTELQIHGALGSGERTTYAWVRLTPRREP